jgi:hypothetical protein
MDVSLVGAEVENVVLRDAHVLDQLPHAVREPGRLLAAFLRRQILHRVVKTDMRLLPIEGPDKVIAQRLVAHGAYETPNWRRW